MADNPSMDNILDFDRYDRIRPIRWTGESLELLDQRNLPFAVAYDTSTTSDDVAAAIHALTVRGAPAIGIAAAWGVVLAAREVQAATGREAALALAPAMARLNASRPTAVNLAWALARMQRALGEIELVGPKTTLPFHRVILQENDFTGGGYTTDLTGGKNIKDKLKPEKNS